MGTGSQLLGPLSAAFPGVLAVSWIRSKATGIQADTQYGVIVLKAVA